MRKAYTGIKDDNLPPVIEGFRLSSRKNVVPRERIYLTGKVHDPEGDAVRVKVSVYDIQLAEFMLDYAREVTGQKSVFIEAPYKPGLYRVYLFAIDANGNIASANHSLEVAY